MMNATYVDIANVAHWFLSINAQDEYVWSTDFPAMSSPWPMSIYSWTEPKTINREGEILKSPMPGAPHEVLLLQHEIEHQHFCSGVYLEELPALIKKLTGITKKLPRSYMADFQEHFIDYAIANNITCKWVQLIFYRFPQSELIGGAMWVQFLDTAGRFIGGPERGPILISGTGILTDNDAAIALYPLMFALSLLHCRNVEIRDRPISRQQRRVAERSGKPAITYKELVIDAFRRQVRYETSQSGESEIKRALHICRGHFATYTDDNPLFGKYTGTFWRPMHVRGDKAAGEIRKTYKIKGEG